MYEILATISKFGKELYRGTIVSIIDKFLHGIDKAQSCQYLVALILLYCPSKIKILEAKRVFERKRRFYTFSITDPRPQEFTIDQLQEKYYPRPFYSLNVAHPWENLFKLPTLTN